MIVLIDIGTHKAQEYKSVWGSNYIFKIILMVFVKYQINFKVNFRQ